MDAAGIDMQVLSQTAPGIQAVADKNEATKFAKEANDFVAEVVAKHPTRFASFAAVALQDPHGAADELERAVRQLGMVGAMVNGHTLGEYLDEQKFAPFLEKLEALDVPLYLHPTNAVEHKVYDKYPELLGAMWGWASETGFHFLRMLVSGVFDRHPKLKVILGHMGENIPFCVWRIDSRFKVTAGDRNLKKLPSQYIKENLMITTSGMFSPEALRCSIDTLGVSNVMFSVDYPYEDIMEASKFIDDAPLSDEEREKVSHLNAQKLLKLKSTASVR